MSLILMKKTASSPAMAAPQKRAAPAGKLGQVPGMRRNRSKDGAQGRSGLVAEPDAALAREPAGPMDKTAGAGHRRQNAVENNTTQKTPPSASQNPETGVRGAFDYAAIGMALVAPNGRWLKVNRSLCGIVGYSEQEMLGLTYNDITHPDDLAKITAHAAKLLAGEIATYEIEKRYVHKRGHNVHVLLSMSLVRDGNDAPLYIICQVQNISARKAAEDALYAEQERARVTLNSIGDAVLTTDTAGNVTYLNAVGEKMTGWSREEAAGRPLAEVFHILDGLTRQSVQNPALMAIAENKIVEMAAGVVLIRRDGVEAGIEDSAAPIHDRDGMVTGAVLVFHDVTASREMAEAMAHLAHHDFLTDLPNRALVNERLTRAIALAGRNGRKAAVLFLDLDHFKLVNDSLGHATGDKLLVSVTKRLQDCVRVSDTVSRQGGDEFLILLPDIEGSQDAAHFAAKLLAALAQPHHVDGQDLHVTISIGIGLYPDNGQDTETVIKSADTAMYHAKENGRNNYQFFAQQMNTRVVGRLATESSLHGALARNEFCLHYQPKINLESGALTGAEALIRWLHPLRGTILPAQFISIAEKCGLIMPIGNWVLRETCRQAKAWIDAGLEAVPISVNISAVQFRHKDFLEDVRGILLSAGLEPRWLELELTESVLMQDAASTTAVLQALKTMGVRLAVDDFGTGYSSLSYLSKFPIDVLKIDQLFVHNIHSDTDDAPIISAVINMGRGLKHRVIAEGVETEQQFRFLQARSCDEGQGHYFSRPLNAGDFSKFLKTRASPPPHGERLIAGATG
jgi:diguanylate cyclase (GGDEF)-like protein/PAS domain S-box-containing protein